MVKHNQLLKSFSMKIIALAVVAAFAVAMFAPVALAREVIYEPLPSWAKADEIVIVKQRIKNKIVINECDLADLQCSTESIGINTGDRYPVLEIMEIGGIPWQDTVYADVIKDNLTYYPNGYLSQNPELLEIVLDKRFNGEGDKVCALFSQGKSVQEIKQILGNEKQDIKKEETPLPQPDEISIVLYLDKTNYSVAENGIWQEATLDVAPTIENGRTLVPFRAIMERFGANVKWIPESQQVKVEYKEKEVVLTIGSTDALVNGQATKIDVPAKIVNGRTLIPIRFVSQQIGMNVEWNEQARSVLITSQVK